MNRYLDILILIIYVLWLKNTSWLHQIGNRYIHTNNSSHTIFAWPRLQEILQEYYFSCSTGNCVLWYFEVCILPTMFHNTLHKSIYCQRCITKGNKMLKRFYHWSELSITDAMYLWSLICLHIAYRFKYLNIID